MTKCLSSQNRCSWRRRARPLPRSLPLPLILTLGGGWGYPGCWEQKTRHRGESTLLNTNSNRLSLLPSRRPGLTGTRCGHLPVFPTQPRAEEGLTFTPRVTSGPHLDYGHIGALGRGRGSWILHCPPLPLSSCSRGDRPLVDLYVELAGFSNDAGGCHRETEGEGERHWLPRFCRFPNS